MLRTIILVLGLCASFFVLGVRATVARSETTLMDLGRHLAVIAETGVGTDQRSLVINGQALGFRVVTVDAGIDAVLDYYDRWCRGGSADLPLDAGAARDISSSQSTDSSLRDLTLRSRSGDEGYVACVHTGGRRLSGEALAARAAAFAETGDLGALGRFHYVFVQGLASSTRAVSVWTGPSFRPLELFPESGDAPGLDMPGIPRPPGGRRVLSAGEAGESAYLVHYELDGGELEAMTTFYRAHFARNSWRVLSDTAGEEGGRDLIVGRGSFLYVLRVAAEPGTPATVTVARAE